MDFVFINSEIIASETKTFFFKRPLGFDYLPGQFVYITLPSPRIRTTNPTRIFSLSSSPTEKDLVSITTRIRKGSIFKHSLNSLKTGEPVNIGGPSGTFIIDERETGVHLLVAGGIGITPFRSVIKYHTDMNLSTSMQLIYANSVPSKITFYDELLDLEKKNRGIKIDMTVSTVSDPKKWKGLSGRVDAEKINKLVNNMKSKTVWICGPPSFVYAMETMFSGLKVPPKEIRIEKFTGY